MYNHLFGRRSIGVRCALCLLCVWAFFLLSRLPFFLSFPLPMTMYDSATYLWPLEQIEQGKWPNFDLRTPGYPLFWWSTRVFSTDILALTFAQNALTLFSVTIILLLLARYSPRLLLPATFALVIFISAPDHLNWDVTILSDSVFTNCVLLFALFLYLALTTGKRIFSFAASAIAGSAILVRPNGIFLIPVLIVAGAHCGWAWRDWKTPLRYVMPMALVLGALVLYNGILFGQYGITSGGSLAMLWSTSIYVDEDASLPPAINAAIASKNSRIGSDDRRILQESWDLQLIRRTTSKYLYDALVPILLEMNKLPEQERSRVREQVYRRAIAQHPDIYAKIFAANFVEYFRMIASAHVGGHYYGWNPAEQYRVTFLERAVYVENLKTYYQPKRPPGVSFLDIDGTRRVVAEATSLTESYRRWVDVRTRLFQNDWWNLPLILGLLIAAIYVGRAARANADSVMVLLLIAGVIGSAAVSAVIGHVEERYSYTLEFVNYLLAGVAPIVIGSWLGMDTAADNGLAIDKKAA